LPTLFILFYFLSNTCRPARQSIIAVDCVSVCNCNWFKGGPTSKEEGRGKRRGGRGRGEDGPLTHIPGSARARDQTCSGWVLNVIVVPCIVWINWSTIRLTCASCRGQHRMRCVAAAVVLSSHLSFSHALYSIASVRIALAARLVWRCVVEQWVTYREYMQSSPMHHSSSIISPHHSHHQHSTIHHPIILPFQPQNLPCSQILPSIYHLAPLGLISRMSPTIFLACGFSPWVFLVSVIVIYVLFNFLVSGFYLFHNHLFLVFYAPQLYRQVLLRRVLAMGILSVCSPVRLSVRLSRPGTDSMPGEIETPGLHHMIA